MPIGVNCDGWFYCKVCSILGIISVVIARQVCGLPTLIYILTMFNSDDFTIYFGVNCDGSCYCKVSPHLAWFYNILLAQQVYGVPPLIYVLISFYSQDCA